MLASGRLGELVNVPGPDGSMAVVALHGAHVVSWKTADDVERLFLSTRATTDGGAAIRGGIPVCFPQFAGLGPLPKHGFARTAQWRHRGSGEFNLHVAADAWPGWPHECELVLNVGVGPSTLSVALTVRNIGATPLEFTGALHSYMSCGDVRNVRVSGLDGRPTHGGGQVSGDIAFGSGESDVDLSVLRSIGPVLCSESGRRKMLCAQTGFPDVVVWNIGEKLGAEMKDLGDGEWMSYVCIEAAAVERSITLDPGSTWHGSQLLVVP